MIRSFSIIHETVDLFIFYGNDAEKLWQLVILQNENREQLGVLVLVFSSRVLFPTQMGKSIRCGAARIS